MYRYYVSEGIGMASIDKNCQTKAGDSVSSTVKEGGEICCQVQDGNGMAVSRTFCKRLSSALQFFLAKIARLI